jgi:hypothetical protein
MLETPTPTKKLPMNHMLAVAMENAGMSKTLQGTKSEMMGLAKMWYVNCWWMARLMLVINNES